MTVYEERLSPLWSSPHPRHRFDQASPIPGSLATLLAHAVNLRTLSLQCVEDLIDASATVGDALVALKNLDTLELLDIGPKTFDLLLKLFK